MAGLLFLAWQQDSPIRASCEPGDSPPEKKRGLHRCKPLIYLVVMGGIEPPTYGL